MDVPTPEGAALPHQALAHPGRVLIVDDHPANLEVLKGLLDVSGYDTQVAHSGEAALASARESPPDLVLMDIQMPGMGGFEACRAFREDAALAAIPVVFLSALATPEEKVRAFQTGGTDYITKPFQAPEVMARVAHHLRAARLEALLTRRNAELLDAASHIQELDLVRSNITAMLVHDLRSPLQGAQLALDMVAEGRASFDEMQPRIHEAMDRMGKLLTEMLDISRAQGSGFHLALSVQDPRPMIQEVLHLVESQARAARVAFQAVLPDTLPAIAVDAAKFDRALINLLGNAFKYTPPGGEVRFGCAVVEGEGIDAGTRWLQFTVTDSGRGIPPDQLPFIFDPFRQVQSTDAEQGVGLGLAIVQRIIAGHRGRILAQSQVGVGTTFTVTLPLAGG